MYPSLNVDLFHQTHTSDNSPFLFKPCEKVTFTINHFNIIVTFDLNKLEPSHFTISAMI